MKFSVIADTHNLHENLSISKDIDLLICCGDFCLDGTSDEAYHFLHWYASLPVKYKILCPGNHDNYVELNEEEIRSFSIKNNILFESDGLIEIEGTFFYLYSYFPFVVKEFGYQVEANKFATHCRKIPEMIDFLVTHNGAFGILDKTQGEHIGEVELSKLVKRVKPIFHLHGHIHESFGSFNNGKTISINASCKRDLDKGHYTPDIYKIC